MAGRELNVLHLASFVGNIGDNANHVGFRDSLKRNVSYDLRYTNLEIREFYWKERRFDDQFVALCNQHDLVVIGGGNYFELWVEGSETGTSIDISIDTLKRIDAPILFNALGVDSGQGVPEVNAQKFRAFLDFLLASDRYIVSVRNDGALDTLARYVGPEYPQQVHHVPDAGFFTTVHEHFHPELNDGGTNLVINLAGDMVETRFAAREPDGITYDEFLQEFADTLSEFVRSTAGARLIFVPHIFRDIETISKVLEYFPDPVRRTKIRVAPYLIGDQGQDYLFDLYRQADLVLGMRFHANVCPIGLLTPTLGLVNYRQIEMLYRELDMNDRCIRVNVAGFGQKLLTSMHSSLENSSEIRNLYGEKNTVWREKLTRFHQNVDEWLSRQIG